jgi:hypothetical protein
MEILRVAAIGDVHCTKWQYRIDIGQWGYRDGRLRPEGRMTVKQADALDREP